MEYTINGTFNHAWDSLYSQVFAYIPTVVLAAVIVILGWILGNFLSGVLTRILKIAKVDNAADSLGMKTLSARTGRTMSIAQAAGFVVKWSFFLVSFFMAAEVLGLRQVSDFLYHDVLGFASHALVAMAVLLLGVLAANFFGELVGSVVSASGVYKGSSLAALTRWTILIFSVIIALEKLGLAEGFLHDLFRAVVAMLAIAGGLAFGLGGKDHARKVLDKVEADLNR